MSRTFNAVQSIAVLIAASALMLIVMLVHAGAITESILTSINWTLLLAVGVTVGAVLTVRDLHSQLGTAEGRAKIAKRAEADRKHRY